MSDNLNILVVDDDRRMAKTLVDILRIKGYKAEEAYSGSEALEKLAEERFNCVFTDIKMPGINGVDLFRTIKSSQPDLPVVLMTAYSIDRLVKHGLKEGALAALPKPLDINLLLGYLSSLRKGLTVVIVDDDPDFCKTLGDILSMRDFAVTPITDPHNVMEALQPEGQMVLLDIKLNSIDGLTVLKQIRKQFPHLPVVLVTGYGEEMAEKIKAAMQLRAYTCLYKPLQIEELLQVLSQIRTQKLRTALGQTIKKHRGVK